MIVELFAHQNSTTWMEVNFTSQGKLKLLNKKV